MAQRVWGPDASSRTAKMALFDEFARLGQALANGRRLEILAGSTLRVRRFKPAQSILTSFSG